MPSSSFDFNQPKEHFSFIYHLLAFNIRTIFSFFIFSSYELISYINLLTLKVTDIVSVLFHIVMMSLEFSIANSMSQIIGRLVIQ